MFFNKKKIRLDETSFFGSWMDCHSHLLPGVDDGFRKMEDTLRVLKGFESIGVRKICLTPHIMEDCPNTVDGLYKVYAELMGLYEGKVEIFQAAEYMVDMLFDEWVKSGNFLTIGEGRYVLLETSYFNPPVGLEARLGKVISSGKKVLLAHPERYMYMDEGTYTQLKERGIAFQLNLLSLSGWYGRQVMLKAQRLLVKGMYDAVGSDLHSELMFEKMLNMELDSKILNKLKEIGGGERLGF